ncbi:MAG: hypothetical protein LKE46_09605 [Clostridium sp.]|jgi:hypothetical protein|uniref:hypothetical protein n=1 Tax=Clostridium sp. TaxID=1506 RepID=UPI0025BBC6DE|nr:hypothetical protein [Clostridium sp.]MCH3964519.1 hypothetical protein [Clostridium sp.]MCI1870064.1 hypothetical protein [Clostridium sp.]
MDILNYLAELRYSAGDIHIHAIGVYSYRDTKYDEGSRFVRILWKEKFVMANIEDEYDLY